MHAMRRALTLILTLLLLAPATAGAATSTKKGIWGPVDFNNTEQFPIYKSLGAGIYQATLNWNEIALARPIEARDPEDATYEWPQEIDDALAAASETGIRVVLTVTGTPDWANGGKPPRYAPTKPADFVDFVTAAARRYPGVHLWSIWDGPSDKATFQPASPTVYARLLDGAYGALKAASKQNLVIGGNSTTKGTVPPQKWIAGLKLPNGKRPRLDMYGHDPVTTRKPSLKAKPLGHGEADLSDVDTLHDWVDAAFGNKKLFLSGFALRTDSGHLTPGAQASWLTAGLRIVRSQSYIYTLAYRGLLDGDKAQGGLEDAVGKAKPALAAFKAG
jgi:hypothetical protein